MKNELKVIGIMNGTSLDGIDYVLVKIKRTGKSVDIKYLDHASTNFTPEMQTHLRRAVSHEMKVNEFSELHHDLGRKYASDLKSIMKKRKWKADLIGLHGQTVYHRGGSATLQLGEPSYMSAELGLPVVSDFRTKDIAAGGQGAPLASLFHQVAFKKHFPKRGFALQNIGGIANLSYVNSKGQLKLAFDTGPGNMLIDSCVQSLTNNQKNYDDGGKLARTGLAEQKFIDQALTDKFFASKPPKSCGREEFGQAYFTELKKSVSANHPEDLVTTATELTARSIAEAYKAFVPKDAGDIVICGGGAKNDYLLSRIQFHLPKHKLHTVEDFNWPTEAIEGAAFALLAAYRLWGMPNNVPETTGARKAVVMGKITEA